MDRAVLLWVVAHRTPWATAPARALMAVGTQVFPAAVAGLGALILVAAFRRWRLAAVALLAGVVAVVLSDAAKLLVHRSRPPTVLALVTVHGYSMPSTDAALTLAMAVVLIGAAVCTGSRAGRVLASVIVLGVVVVGAALVYLGAHWTSDVLAGWVLGAATGVATWRLLPDRGGSGLPWRLRSRV